MWEVTFTKHITFTRIMLGTPLFIDPSLLNCKTKFFIARNPELDQKWSTLDQIWSTPKFLVGPDLVHPGPLQVPPENV